MLNSSNAVRFKIGSSLDLSIEALSVEYDWEPIGGKVEEDEEFELIENWSSYRIIITVHFYASFNDAITLTETFLPSKAKVLEIDDVLIPVVLEAKPVKFKHLLNRNFKADMKLRFRHKSPGALPPVELPPAE